MRDDPAGGDTDAARKAFILPGGGIALLNVLPNVQAELSKFAGDAKTGVQIIIRALEEPLRRIVSNGGQEPSVILNRVDESTDPAFGYNAATRTYGDLLQMGVIDPAKVTRLALQNAASIASLILSTDCLIARAPKANTDTAAAGLATGAPLY